MKAAAVLILTSMGAIGMPSHPEATSCSVTALRNNPEGYHWPLADIERFVDEADVIVRAVATAVDPPTEETQGFSRIRFRTVETIRGEDVAQELMFLGKIVDWDDFNDGEVPYRIVRSSGQRGMCSATDYRLGAEYLFILKELSGALSPYWASLAPMNEQTRGAEDPWVQWVRARLR